MPITKATTEDLILLTSEININLSFIHENEVTESHINNQMNNDVNKFKNAFNSNIDNNATTRKRRPTPVVNRYPERDTLSVFK